MRAVNFKENNTHFSFLQESVNLESPEGSPSRVKRITPAQMKPGQLVKFTYTKTGYAYTAVVASTKRAPFGRYTARNTRNPLVTMYLLHHYSLETQVEFLRKLYSEEYLTEKMKMTRYHHEAHNEYKNRFFRFWSNIMTKVNLRVPSKTKLDSRNFRTFITHFIENCEVLG